MMHVADAHLGEVFAIKRAFDAIVVFTPGKAIPHGFYPGVDGCCGPVGITAIGHDTAQMLELFVLVFNACLEPVLAVEIHYDTALVETVMAFGKVGSHGETEEITSMVFSVMRQLCGSRVHLKWLISSFMVLS